jgi:S-adenosylmethionine synthetase
LSHQLANEIFEKVSGLKEVYVWLLSQIGRQINDPKVIIIQFIPENETNVLSIQKEITTCVEEKFERIEDFCKELAEGKIPVC